MITTTTHPLLQINCGSFLAPQDTPILLIGLYLMIEGIWTFPQTVAFMLESLSRTEPIKTMIVARNQFDP